jgi:antitoxin (DNA-binding transcriptional repressor) of toxin-antitoxin stability system
MYNDVQNPSGRDSDSSRWVQEQPMKHVSFTEFRRNAASVFNSVERGEAIVVLRHGKAIAEIVPMPPDDRILSWKRPGIKLAVGHGASLSREILKERKSGHK